MADEGEYPLLPMPAATSVPPVERPPPRGGVKNPPKNRQIQRLEPQFLELQRVLEAHSAILSRTAAATGPEHVLVFETNGPPKDFLDTVTAHPELEWLLEHEERVEQDEDFNLEGSDRPISACVYMVMFNQAALEQLLSCWQTYKTLKRMPSGLGAWSAVFRCLRSIRRWGVEDRLREADLLRDVMDPVEPTRLITVEIELWTRTEARRASAEAAVRQLVEEAQGAVLDSALLLDIRYHALLVELPHGYLERLLRERDVALLLVDDIYLLRPVPQCLTEVDVTHVEEGAALARVSVEGAPICALLDGLPMENHPQLRGHLLIDDPDDWAPLYPVAERKHGTAMASLIVHGDQSEHLAPLRQPIYARPILRPSAGGERAPRSQLWLDLIHRAVRRIVAMDGPVAPVAPTVRIVNLSVGDAGRPYLHEPSPLARLLDWLAWKHRLLFIVSAGNHDTDLPPDCGDDAAMLRFVFGGSRHRKLLSPAETLNGLTVGALSSDGAPPPTHAGQRAIPQRPDLPAAYSALGRGLRGAVKPDLLAPGGRRLFTRRLPTNDAPWTPATRRDVGHVVAVPGPAGSKLTTRLSGTSNAAALTSRAAIVIHSAVAALLEQPEAGSLASVPTALFVKALLVHTAEWPAETAAYVQQALVSLLDPSRGKDHLAGLLGYGVLRAMRGVACAPERATLVGGGFIAKDQRAIHQLPIPATLHLFRGWRRLTASLAWFTPINPADRRYRIARLRMELPKGSSSPLLVKGGQVHADATTRGTVQHTVMELDGPVISTDETGTLEIAVTCSEDAGFLDEPVPYAVIVSIEVAPETGVQVYEAVATRLRMRAPVPVRRGS